MCNNIDRAIQKAYENFLRIEDMLREPKHMNAGNLESLEKMLTYFRQRWVDMEAKRKEDTRQAWLPFWGTWGRLGGQEKM
jgi:hypothetical protein